MNIFSKISHAQGGCQKCSIVPTTTKSGERFNDVRISAECRAEFKAEEDRINALPDEDIIREIVNGRVLLNECKPLYERLYDELHSEMPYGTAKARDGDPDEWITNWLCNNYEHLIEEEASV